MVEMNGFTRTLDSFKSFLQASGYAVEEPRNEWEVLIAKKDGSVSSVFRNKRDKLTFPKELTKAYRAFQKGYRDMKSEQKAELRQRDGDCCFYCGDVMAEGEETIEHLLAVAHDGTDAMENLVLAHSECNRRADKLPLIEKIKLREAHQKALQPLTQNRR